MTSCPVPGPIGTNVVLLQVAMLALISWPMAQMKTASSLAIAATTTVGFLPLAIIERVDEGADQHSKLWRGEGGGCAVEDVV
jgi:hypothetical protein